MIFGRRDRGKVEFSNGYDGSFQGREWNIGGESVGGPSIHAVCEGAHVSQFLVLLLLYTSSLSLSLCPASSLAKLVMYY